jgi:O-acetyl-ADP-ribose deacetylase
VCQDRIVTVIEVVVGDITREDVDAIVNAANESLLGGGAVAPCEPGDAKATPAFDLDPPVRHVIHTVGPFWAGGDRGEADVLASCYRRSLQVADELGARTVAFPAIATGVYGFPADRAARIAVGTITTTTTAVERIRLVAFDESNAAHLRSALAAAG